MSDTRTLVRNVKVGESISLDGGRIVLELGERSGRSVAIRMTVPEGMPVAWDHRRETPGKGTCLLKIQS